MIFGLCFISYNLGKLQSQVNKFPSQTTTHISNPVVDDVVIAERRIPRIRRYPYYPVHHESKWMNLTTIRPIIQLNKEVYHINDKLYISVFLLSYVVNQEFFSWIQRTTQFHLLCNFYIVIHILLCQINSFFQSMEWRTPSHKSSKPLSIIIEIILKDFIHKLLNAEIISFLLTKRSFSLTSKKIVFIQAYHLLHSFLI